LPLNLKHKHYYNKFYCKIRVKKIIPIKKYFTILDFGCGTGLLAYNFDGVARKIVGIDTSKKMVETFNEKSTSPNIKAYQKDIDTLNEKFDLIISSMTFHHIKEIETTVKKLRNKLKKDGFICIADLIKEDGSFQDEENDGVYHFGFEIEKLKELFENNGFENISENIVYTIKKNKNYPVFLLYFKKNYI